jgi:Fibronectin type III domain
MLKFPNFLQGRGRRVGAVLTSACLVGGAAVGIIGSNVSGAGAASPGPVVYSAIPSPIPGNLPSLGYQATQTSEFGDEVGLVSHATPLASARVLMSSWGCQIGSGTSCSTTPGATFSHPITFKVYAVDNSTPGSPAVGALLTQKTQTFAIPYRPTADNTDCAGGAWFNGTSCFNGFATPITFDFTTVAPVALPAQVIWTVVYNTSNYGPAPIGSAPCQAAPSGCAYDSLNVALNPTNSVGTDTNPDGVFWNTSTAGWYCDGGPGGTLREDKGIVGGGPGCTPGADWTGLTPAGELQLAAPVTPANPGNKPAAPRPVAAVPLNHGAKVNWVAQGNGGSPITGYVVTPYIGGTAKSPHVFNSTATSEVITGLTNKTAYTFKISAKNALGIGAPSPATAVIIAGAPGKPGKVTATKGNTGVLKVAFNAPKNNGAAITNFTATCTSKSGGVTRSRSKATGSPIGVSGLTVGKTYRCTVFATNGRGKGATSDASALVTT